MDYNPYIGCLRPVNRWNKPTCSLVTITSMDTLVAMEIPLFHYMNYIYTWRIFHGYVRLPKLLANIMGYIKPYVIFLITIPNMEQMRVARPDRTHTLPGEDL